MATKPRGLVTLDLTRFEAGLLWSVLEAAVASGHRTLAAEDIQRLTEDPHFPWVFERLVQSVRSFDRRSETAEKEQ